MKKALIKFITCFITLTLLLSIGLVACKKDENPDDGKEPDNEQQEENKDDKEPIDGKIKLVEDGVANFKIVYNFEMASNELKKAVSDFQKLFTAAGVETTVVDSKDKSSVQDCEILIGALIENRDGYTLDTTDVGNDGYKIEVKDKKVMIQGGNDAATIKALNWFAIIQLKLQDGTVDRKNISIDKDFKAQEKQEYSVTKITIGDTDISEFSIFCDENDLDAKETAEEFKNRIYSIYGLNLEFKDNGKHTIFITNTEDSGADGFRVREKDGNLYVECAIPKVTKDTTRKFLNQYFSFIAEGEITLKKNFSYSTNVRYISYIEYGKADGGGIRDDYEAVKKTHERANFTGQTVRGDAGCKFNMGAHTEPIEIKTDVIWSGVEFIVDDRIVTPHSLERETDIFKIASDYEPQQIEGMNPLKEGQKNVGMTFEGTTMLHIVNSNVKQYIRSGANANDGTDMQEIIIVDKNGDVDPMTPIMWDYDEVTSCTAYRIDDKPISILGGKITTHANRGPTESIYYSRGILVERSNTTIDGLEHEIRGEGTDGCPYVGFIFVTKCNNVLIKDTILQGHKIYRKPHNNVRMGTYDFGAKYANAITLQGVTQQNDINDTNYWGVMGTNFCKNLKYDGCKLSRFDAHQGVWNATIINSELGHQRINAIGGGTLRVENTIVNTNMVVNLRNDYGSTWKGELILKDITVRNTDNVELINGVWDNHYFGYTCYMPEKVTIDGIKVLNENFDTYIFAKFSKDLSLSFDQPEVGGEVNKNPYVLTKEVIITARNYGIDFKVSQNPIFRKVKITNL